MWGTWPLLPWLKSAPLTGRMRTYHGKIVAQPEHACNIFEDAHKVYGRVVDHSHHGKLRLCTGALEAAWMSEIRDPLSASLRALIFVGSGSFGGQTRSEHEYSHPGSPRADRSS
eukprot:scaffold267830_cov32-Tisochrysis_lutea.AAC.3